MWQGRNRAKAIIGITALGALLALSTVVWPESIGEALSQHERNVHQGVASITDVRDIRIQIGGMLAMSVVLIGGFGSLLYAKGVAELRGELHTINAQVNGRIDQMNERLVALTGRVETQCERVSNTESQIANGYARMMNLIEQHAVLFKAIEERLG